MIAFEPFDLKQSGFFGGGFDLFRNIRFGLRHDLDVGEVGVVEFFDVEQALENLFVIAGFNKFWVHFYGDVSRVAVLLEFGEEAFDRQNSFVRKIVLAAKLHIGKMNMHHEFLQGFVDTDEVVVFLRDAGRIDAGVLEFLHFVDVPHGMFRNNSQKGFGRGVFQGNGNILLLADLRDFVFKPLDVFEVENLGGLDHNNAAAQGFCHLDAFHQFFGTRNRGGLNGHDRNLVLVGKKLHILGILRIEVLEIDLEIDTAVPRLFDEVEDTVEPIAAE